jgi:hypothetical protein
MASVPIEDLVDEFLDRGGKINKCYLSDLGRSRPALVYMKGWYSGSNLRTAITRALADQN